MITTKDITPGFTFKATNTIYEVLKVHNANIVDLLNLTNNNTFLFNIKPIVDGINKGIYYIEPRVVKPLTYIEEL